MYTVDYFIKKFEAIPEDKWHTGEYSDGIKKCAMGHCQDRTRRHTNSLYGPEFDAIVSLFKTLGGGDYGIAIINDGCDLRYRQPTPKQRILAALYDIKKLNQGTEPSTERRNNSQIEEQRADITKQLSQIEIISETSDKIKSHAKEFSTTH